MRLWHRLLGALGAAFAAGLAVAGLAAAAGAPTVTTGAVTSFDSTSAAVSGSVDPNGAATSWHVEYGKDTKYGSQTAATDAGAGTTAANVSTTITGLTPKTTYHYRFVATNASGTAQGTDGTFTTAAAVAPTVVTGVASGVAGTSATLNGSVNPNGRPTSWYFEYGKSTQYGTKTPQQNAGDGSSSTNVAAPASGLKAGTVYHFRIVATSDGGMSRGADQTFTTPGGGAAPAVSTQAASGVSSTAATLKGSVTPSGQSTSWHFELGTTTAYGTTTPARDAGAGTKAVAVSEPVAGLVPGTTYHFRVVATNATGTTTGQDRTFTTAGGPTVITGTAQGVASTSATLTGQLDPLGRSTSWYFEYGTTTRYGSRSSTRSENGTGIRGVSAAVSGLQAGTTYHFRLVASSSAGTTRGLDGSFRTPAAGVTLNQPAALTTFGRAVTLSGTVAGGQSGVSVTVLAQAFGDPSFRTIATVRSGAGGGWIYTARPTIRTAYQASANGATSRTVTVAVRPAVSIGAGRLRISTHVSAGSSLAGHYVQLQRLSGARWVTVRRARLSSSASATFRAAVLPRGRSTIRIAMSVNQSGPGYLAGFSRAVSYSR
jgi:phosphodiesterase/alkaline phosphatase D-like protein